MDLLEFQDRALSLLTDQSVIEEHESTLYSAHPIGTYQPPEVVKHIRFLKRRFWKIHNLINDPNNSEEIKLSDEHEEIFLFRTSVLYQFNRLCAAYTINGDDDDDSDDDDDDEPNDDPVTPHPEPARRGRRGAPSPVPIKA